MEIEKVGVENAKSLFAWLIWGLLAALIGMAVLPLTGCGIRFEYYGKTGIDDNYRHATHLVGGEQRRVIKQRAED